MEALPYDDVASAGPAADEFCRRLHEHSFALLRFPVAAEAEVAALRSTAAGFFALQAEAKREAAGDFRFVGDTYAGYRDSASCDAEFLEVHTDAAGGTYPPLPAPDGLADASLALFSRLDAMAKRLLTILAAHVGVAPGAFLDPLQPSAAARAGGDNGGGSGGGGGGAGSAAAGAHETFAEQKTAAVAADVSSSVLRVCHYRRRQAAASAAEGHGADEGVEVLFDEHTDSSLLTLSTLCPGAPGLQLRDEHAARRPWVDVESLPCVSSIDVEVHVGDFLAFLSRDYFPSCAHRVTRPTSGPGRLSFPFLLRPHSEHVLETSRYDPEGTNEILVEVSGIRCRDLRRLLDARGKRLLEEKRKAQEAEEARRRRARAYREALAKGAALDSSEDEEEAGAGIGAAAAANAAAAAADAGGDEGAPSCTLSLTPTSAVGLGTSISIKGPTAMKAPTAMKEAARGGGQAAAPSAQVVAAPAAAAATPPLRAVWGLRDLPVLRYPAASPEYLFVYKQHDLHMDHADEAVTLDTQLSAVCPSLADPSTAFGFRHPHQLDYATSGLLCVALTKAAAANASRLFEQRKASKLYLALVEGHVTFETTTVAAAVGEDASDPRGFKMALEGSPGCSRPLPASTTIYAVATGTLQGVAVSKLLLCPSSGRRHQLRLHCASLGHAVVGDTVYSPAYSSSSAYSSSFSAADGPAAEMPRMMLHAWRLRLPLRRGASKRGKGGVDAPVSVSTADPFPFAEAAHPPQPHRGTGLEGPLSLLPEETALEHFDGEAVVRELRAAPRVVGGPPKANGGAAGADAAGVPSGVSFRVLSPAGQPSASPRGEWSAEGEEKRRAPDPPPAECKANGGPPAHRPAHAAEEEEEAPRGPMGAVLAAAAAAGLLAGLLVAAAGVMRRRAGAG